MADPAGEFSSSQGIYIRINMRIDISISIRPTVIKFDKWLHL